MEGDAGPRRGGWGAPAFAALVAWITAIAQGDFVVADPDIYSHVAVGRWILQHGQVPSHDVFSHSAAGQPWVPHEWLAEVAMAGLYGLGGVVALVAATAACFALTLALLTRFLARDLPLPATAVGALSAWGMCFIHLLARPHVMALPLLVAWTAGLVMARTRDRAPSPWLLPLMMLWANLHGSFVLGLALTVAFAAEAMFEADDRHGAWRVLRQWLPFLVLAMGAAMLTPNGWIGLVLPFRVSGMTFALSWISEWRQPDFQSGHPTELWLLLFLLASLFIGFRLPITRIAMLLLLIHMALLHQRHAEILGLVAPLITAPVLGPQVKHLIKASTVRFSRSIAHWSLLAATIIAVCLTAWLLPRVAIPARYHPIAAIEAAARAGATGGPVLNSYAFGGYLMLIGIPTLIDGRIDMYGDALAERYASPAALDGILDQYRISWALLEPDDPLVPALDARPAWHRLHADEVAVVYLRKEQPKQP